MTHSIPPPVRDELFPLALKNSQETWRQHGYTFLILGELKELYRAHAILTGKYVPSHFDFQSMLEYASFYDVECVRLGLTKKLKGNPIPFKVIRGIPF